MSNNQEFAVNINFDEASKAWMSNKIAVGSGHYKYICKGLTVKGHQCKKKPSKHCNYCHIHKKLN